MTTRKPATVIDVRRKVGAAASARARNLDAVLIQARAGLLPYRMTEADLVLAPDREPVSLPEAVDALAEHDYAEASRILDAAHALRLALPGAPWADILATALHLDFTR